jgi:hypothetical protein
MNEKDFVTAWLLAARAANEQTVLTHLAIKQLIAQAKEVYKQIEDGHYETDCGTTN